MRQSPIPSAPKPRAAEPGLRLLFAEDNPDNQVVLRMMFEKMGHLDREDAAFLQDAATLYRAIDHGLRVYSGHAEGRLPQSPHHLEAVTNLVRRWTPEHLHQQPLPDELARIQSATRAYFRRLFG